MRNKYFDLIDQTFYWPQEGFDLEEDHLLWNDINLMEIIKQYGTPLKISYLPKISANIERAKRMFNVAMAKADYKGTYNYCYCTKSLHFQFVLEEALKNDIHIETSSAFDINIIEALYEDGKITKDQFIVSNGFKRPQYIENLARLINKDFRNTIPVFDNMNEVDELTPQLKKPCKIGIRIAAEEEPKFEFYTSRLGVGYKDIVDFYKKKIKDNKMLELKMLHFFINTGINDTAYYWSELLKCVNIYIELKKVCPTLDSLNIGGGFPIKNSLHFTYDYDYMAEEIIQQIKQMCESKNIPEPHIFTEFGSYTVGESGATLFSIMDQKRQNDREKWNMIDGSFMTSLPDAWAISKRFIMLAVNRWNTPYERILLGGLTCDSDDYYNSEQHANAIYFPKYDPEEKQYIGFFHTGAYQESLGGYGGIQHCLIPAPKHVVIDRDKEGEIRTRLFAKEQSYKSMMKVLGYLKKLEYYQTFSNLAYNNEHRKKYDIPLYGGKLPPL
ncbi:MAG: arginine decarboxylase [Owenweeksia sp.]|nr:arginine decarboxylase [Owenweeksia sp.]